MTERRSNWPFSPTDGGPLSRPRIVNLDNVLVAIVDDPHGADKALRALGFTDEQLRSYTSEEMLAHDAAFRANQGLLDRTIGSLVDDGGAMAAYVEFAREGRGAVWVRVADRSDANRVIRHLSAHGLARVWFHGPRGAEVLDLD